VTRGADGRAAGYLIVADESRRGGGVLACPLEWEEHQAAEQAFRDGEEIRLLYVAATRAARRLLISRCEATDEGSPWDGLHAALDGGLASELTIAPVAPGDRPALEVAAEQLRARIAETEAARATASRPTYRSGAVTTRIRTSGTTWLHTPEVRAVHFGTAAPAGQGAGWGRAVHRALEVARAGADRYTLQHACRDFLLEEGCETDERGEPTQLDELIELIGALTRSPLWRRASEAEELLVEVPFTFTLPAAQAAVIGLAPAPEDGESGPAELIDGVIDLAFREPAGWVIADYKTDRMPSAETSAAYRKQVSAYAACWERITGTPVIERVILYTAQGREESW
jgi:ATP-dependent helicase/nuclease subunit A